MNVREAADRIREGYRRGEYFPPELTGQISFDEALRVQLAVLDRKIADGERLAGWKIGLTSAAVRAHFGTDRQPFGNILESGVIASPGEVALDDLAVGCGVEPELCVTMGADLCGPGATPDQARAAVESIAPGMEINQKRSGGVTDFELSVADNLTQWAIVQGPPTPVPDGFDSGSLRVTMSCNGQVRADVVGATSSTTTSSPSRRSPTSSGNTAGAWRRTTDHHRLVQQTRRGARGRVAYRVLGTRRMYGSLSMRSAGESVVSASAGPWP